MTKRSNRSCTNSGDSHNTNDEEDHSGDQHMQHELLHQILDDDKRGEEEEGGAEKKAKKPRRTQVRPKSDVWDLLCLDIAPGAKALKCRHCDKTVNHHQKLSRAMNHLWTCENFQQYVQELSPHLVTPFIREHFIARGVERGKMIAGELYDATDPELVEDRLKARDMQLAYNATNERKTAERARLLKKLLPHAAAGVFVQAPFFCDYGSNIYLEENVYFNYNCVVLDACPVRIGARSLFGPGVQVLTATHPVNPTARASGLEYARPITIGKDVWVGGGAIICPGVTIGDNAVIGAGSVVTKDIPESVIAVGNPCKVMRAVDASAEV